MTENAADTKTTACPSCPTGHMEGGSTLIAFEDSPRQVSNEPSFPIPTPVVVVTGIPAEVCNVCGEAILDAETTERVNELVKSVRYLWNRFPDRLSAEGVVVGGTPGEHGGVVRVDFEGADLSPNRVTVRGEGAS